MIPEIKLPGQNSVENIQLRAFMAQYPEGHEQKTNDIYENPQWLVGDTDSHIPTLAHIVMPDGTFLNQTLRTGKYWVNYILCDDKSTLDGKPILSFTGNLNFFGSNGMEFRNITFKFADGTTEQLESSPPPFLLMGALITEFATI